MQHLFCLVAAGVHFLYNFYLNTMVKITFMFSASEMKVSRAAGLAAGGVAGVSLGHQSTPHTMTGLFAAAVVAVAEQLDRPPTVHLYQ